MMIKTKYYLIVSALMFAFVAIVHLIRFVLGWTAQVGTFSVPLWMSLLTVVICGLVALWGLTLSRRI